MVLLLTDGGAGLMTAADPAQNLILVKDPDLAASEQGSAVDQLRLEQIWSGEALLLRNKRGRSATDAPFTIGWLVSLVLQERRLLRDVGVASLTL
ncbi:peptidase domain-containing ABC transporter, partial [Rhizobiaceae sp. 2RAB30]